MVRPVVSTSTAWLKAADGAREELLQHFDHVIVGVVVVVQQDDMIERERCSSSFVFWTCRSEAGALPSSDTMIEGRGRNGFDGIESS